MKTLLSSEIDDILQRNIFKYIDEDDEGVVRHPSNRGSVIIDGPNKIFVPDAKYRKKRTYIDNSYYSNKYSLSNSNWIRDNENKLENLYNDIKDNSSSTDINNKILEFNREFDNRGILCFDVCNSIKVPKVGTCIIPSYDQMELIIAYRHELDELDVSPYGHHPKLFKYWFDNVWSSYFITCNFNKTEDRYRDNAFIQMNCFCCNGRYLYHPYLSSLSSFQYKSLIPIIEL